MNSLSFYFDLLGPRPMLYYQNNYRYYTPFGFFSTFLSFIILLIFGVYFFVVFIKGSELTIIASKEHYSFSKKLDMSNKILIYQLIDEKGNLADPRMIQTIPTLRYINRDQNDVEYLHETNCDITTNFTKKKQKQILHFDISSYKCISRKNGEPFTIESTSPFINTYINIYLTKCTNTTERNDCYSDEEINDKLRTAKLFFSFYAETVEIDHNDRGSPLQSSLFTDKIELNFDFIYLFLYTIRNVIYQSDNGIIFENINKEEAFAFDALSNTYYIYSKEKQLLIPNALSVIQINIASDYADKYKRIYQKIQNVIANICGITNLIIFIFKMITQIAIDGMMYCSFVEYSDVNKILSRQSMKPSFIRSYKKNNVSTSLSQNNPLTNTSGILVAQDVATNDTATKKKYKRIGYCDHPYFLCGTKTPKLNYIINCKKMVKDVLNVINIMRCGIEMECYLKSNKDNNLKNMKELIDSNQIEENIKKKRKFSVFDHKTMNFAGNLIKNKSKE